MLRFLPLCLLFTVAGIGRAATVNLDGHWNFALDTQRRGEALRWAALPAIAENKGRAGWDTVVVPHCWSNDPRYDYTGAAWYVRQFEAPSVTGDTHLRLRFTSVGDRCRVWVNGTLVGTHDGVNLPFSFDVTSVVRAGSNVVAVEVDNTYSDATIPGSRPGASPANQLYPWWNYGGILGDVSLTTEPAAHLDGMKTDTTFAADGSVWLTFQAKVENRGREGTFTLRASVVPPTHAPAFTAERTVVLRSGERTAVALALTLPATAVHRWDLDHPVLYDATLTLESATGHDTVTHRLGLREIAIHDGQLWLNGEPIKVGGANHARGDPRWGGLEPAAFVDAEMTEMKRAHLEFARLQHFPVSPAMFDWADAHGMLIIAEAGNWGFSPAQLASPAMRTLWQQHMRELVATSWDRPSVVAWSIGNEYNSWSPEGLAWTKDMYAWVKSIDASRPVTFAAIGAEFASHNEDRAIRALNYVDFVCGNYYGPGGAIGEKLDRIHRLWPEKPIVISEFGMRADLAPAEADRIAQFQATLAEVRRRPYVCGLSFWAFNDYLSRYPDTAPDGYRAWGLVRPDRTPRELYRVAAQEFSPAVVTIEAAPDDSATLVVAARADFPTATLRGYALRVLSPTSAVEKEFPLPVLAPGQRWSSPALAFPAGSTARLVRPGGLIAYELTATSSSWFSLDGTPLAGGNVVGSDGRIREVRAAAVHISRTAASAPKGTVLLFPGGAYKILEVVNEGARTAAMLNDLGYDVAMLEYHVSAGDETRELALKDAEDAWRLCTTRASALGLHSQRLIVMGYSAGGHLAARLMSQLSRPERKPDDLVLVYPAYLDERAPESAVPRVQPPSALRTRLIALMAANDRANWLQGCRDYVSAWQKSGGYAVFHELANGGHGFGMKPDRTGELKQWPEELAYFLEYGAKPGVGPFNTHLPWFLTNNRDRLATFAKQKTADQGAVVFLGDSITSKWKNLASSFAGLKIANRGIAGDTTRGMLCRFRDNVLELHPSAIVFMGGINDLTGQPAGTAETIAANVRSMLEQVRDVAPATPALVCEVLPSKGAPDSVVQAVNAAVDRVIADFGNAQRVKTHDAFLKADRSQDASLFLDGTHPNAAGYAIWAGILKPVLERALPHE